MSFADIEQDEELLAAAARVVVAVFHAEGQREQLPAPSLVALRLLETALALYQHSKLEEQLWRTGIERDRQAGPSSDGSGGTA
jgi:hypothetical protein